MAELNQKPNTEKNNAWQRWLMQSGRMLDNEQVKYTSDAVWSEKQVELYLQTRDWSDIDLITKNKTGRIILTDKRLILTDMNILVAELLYNQIVFSVDSVEYTRLITFKRKDDTKPIFIRLGEPTNLTKEVPELLIVHDKTTEEQMEKVKYVGRIKRFGMVGANISKTIYTEREAKASTIVFTNKRLILRTSITKNLDSDGDSIFNFSESYDDLTFFHQNNNELTFKIGTDPFGPTHLIVFERGDGACFFAELEEPVYSFTNLIDEFKAAYSAGKTVSKEKWGEFLGVSTDEAHVPQKCKSVIDYIFEEIEPAHRTSEFGVFIFGQLIFVQYTGVKNDYWHSSFVISKKKDAMEYLTKLCYGLFKESKGMPWGDARKGGVEIFSAMKQICEESLLLEPSNSMVQNNLAIIELECAIKRIRNDPYTDYVEPYCSNTIKSLEKIIEKDDMNYYVYQNLSNIFGFLGKIKYRERDEYRKKSEDYYKKAATLKPPKEGGGFLFERTFVPAPTING